MVEADIRESRIAGPDRAKPIAGPGEIPLAFVSEEIRAIRESRIGSRTHGMIDLDKACQALPTNNRRNGVHRQMSGFRPALFPFLQSALRNS